jgi:hypothetical protein
MKEGRLVELLHSTKQQQQKKTTVNMKRLGYKYTLPFPKYVSVCSQIFFIYFNKNNYQNKPSTEIDMRIHPSFIKPNLRRFAKM